MISIRNLTKEFPVSGGKVAALKNLHLEVSEGEFFVIVGASGSGKTTLLRCVAGLEVPDGGEICIAGRAVASDSPPTWVPSQQRRLGMVFQSYAVWPHLTVYENVALPLAEGAQRIARSEVDRRVREALRLAQLEQLAERSATLLSGGQQQRVALARAIAVNPRLLLMDEPLSNLDARLREEVRGKIRELAKELGSTVLYVTHDQVEAMAVSDKIALMQLGELLQVGAPMELYRSPRRAEVAEFFGQVNWVPGRIVEPGVAETPIGRLRIQSSARPGDEVLVGFRPECLSIVEDDPGAQGNLFHAALRSSTFLGDQFVYSVMVRDRLLVGKSRILPLCPNGRLCLRVDPAELLVFPQTR
ncbi:MAG: ABC transporter ATP-binding protein [Deltaproteobacteria bacterium]|nr:ABC transporter ATP-binding protein [Deltaproteobacteria bacterium]